MYLDNLLNIIYLNDKHFLKINPLSKIFIGNTVKLSNSCFDNTYLSTDMVNRVGNGKHMGSYALISYIECKIWEIILQTLLIIVEITFLIRYFAVFTGSNKIVRITTDIQQQLKKRSSIDKHVVKRVIYTYIQFEFFIKSIY